MLFIVVVLVFVSLLLFKDVLFIKYVSMFMLYFYLVKRY